MKRKPVKDRCCMNLDCPLHGLFGKDNIIRHSFYRTRQGRRTAGHARQQEYLDDNMALLMCHYNFIRPHSALKFGKETRTPAIQAGIVSARLSFRDIFTSRELLFLCLIIWVLIQREKLTRRAECSTLTTVR